MKRSTTCIIPVVLTGKPYERTWSSKDPKTGEERQGSVHVIKGTVIPTDANANSDTLREVEFNINVNKSGVAQKNLVDITGLYFENKEKFNNGEVYAEVETYMGPRANKQGLVSFFSPYINNLNVVSTTEEDQPLVNAALQKGEAVI